MTANKRVWQFQRSKGYQQVCSDG